MMHEKGGFTLVELMIVVAVIGVLATIALPAFQDYTARAQVSEGLVLAEGQKGLVKEFFQNTGRFPSSNISAGANSTITGKYVSKVEISGNGLITAVFSSSSPFKAHGAIDGQSLILTPSSGSGGSVVWSCSGSVAQKYLPTICRTGNN